MISTHGKRSTALFLLLAATLFVMIAASAACAKDFAGKVELSVPTVFVKRANREYQAMAGSNLYSFDTVRTSPSGTATLRLLDDTVIEMAPDTIVHLVDVVFTPKRARLQLHVEKGTARIKTGSIGLKNPRGVKIMTNKTLMHADNSHMLVYVTPAEERVAVEWMPAGPQVRVYNVKTKEALEMKTDKLLLIVADGKEMIVEEIIEEEEETALDA